MVFGDCVDRHTHGAKGENVGAPPRPSWLLHRGDASGPDQPVERPGIAARNVNIKRVVAQIGGDAIGRAALALGLAPCYFPGARRSHIAATLPRLRCPRAGVFFLPAFHLKRPFQ